jgi:hypothetical protein
VNEVVVQSSIASSMGARISVTGPGRSMYLVIGRGPSLESVVKAAEGQVVLRFNGRKMLVTLPFPGYLSLRGSREISHIGPISVDIKRLTRVAQMLSGAVSPGSNGNV